MNDTPMDVVIFNYIKAAVIVVGDFGAAWAFARWARKRLPLFRSKAIRVILFLVGTGALFVAGIGRLGWDIQTWSGSSPAERLDQSIFIILSAVGTFLLMLDYFAGKEEK